jgi:hypothetical protein
MRPEDLATLDRYLATLRDLQCCGLRVNIHLGELFGYATPDPTGPKALSGTQWCCLTIGCSGDAHDPEPRCQTGGPFVCHDRRYLHLPSWRCESHID